MQPTLDNSTIISGVRNGSFIAQPIEDTLAWGQGSIQPQSAFLGDNAQNDLMKAVLDSLEPVSEKESSYSSCTDGRCPVRLLNDEMVPVREQMVGADMVSAFYVAESLGERFYPDANAPVQERVREVANFLQEFQNVFTAVSFARNGSSSLWLPEQQGQSPSLYALAA